MIVEILIILGLTLLCMIACALTAVRLPGTWAVLTIAVVYSWLNDWTRVGPLILAILLGLCVVGEIIELLSSAVLARRAGSSRQAAWAGLLGGLVGMFVFTIPVPVLGTVFGALLGCFTGAAIAELAVRDDWRQGTRVGVFAAIGFVLGTTAKLGVTMMMMALTISSAVFTSPHLGLTDETDVLPATSLPAGELPEDGA